MTRQFGGRFEVVAERLLDYQPRPETTELNNIDDTSAKQRAIREFKPSSAYNSRVVALKAAMLLPSGVHWWMLKGH